MRGSVTMDMPQEKSYTIDDYYNLPDDVRAELINGKIYYQAAPSRIHQKILSKLHQIIANYIDSKGGSCEVYPAPFAVQLSESNKTVVEPDISVICNPDKLDDRGCTGAPDWIIEITSPGTSGHDYLRKLNLYSNYGVREYWIVNPQKQSITVYFFENESLAVPYTFKDKVKVNIYEELIIDFSDIELS